MFKFPDWCYHQLPANKNLWVFLWVIWFSTLWFLSGRGPDPDGGPGIPHTDKLLHFGYFMLGGFLLSNFFYLKKYPLWSWKKIILLSFFIGASVGFIDEHHQTYTPGREGHSIGDIIADICGTSAGIFYCLSMWRRFEKTDKKRAITSSDHP